MAIDPTLPDRSAEHIALQAGDVVGEYVIKYRIGEGGFGAVFRAEHPVIGKSVAIKVLHRKYSGDPEYVSRFIDEARSVNQIGHRNIIDIFAFGQLEDGRHYFVMEYLVGRTLEAHRHAHKRLAVGDAIALLRGLAKALDAAHARKIVHRDLKPDNVFLAEEAGQPLFPKLLDFGIAKLLSDEGPRHSTQSGAPMGTPAYMSPEQARGRAVDHRTDVYSFGVMFYELITGSLPFIADDYADVLAAHVRDQPEPPSQRCAAVDPSIDAPVLRMLEKDPDKRPVKVSAALKAIERAAREAGIDVPNAAPTSTVIATEAIPTDERIANASTRLPAQFQGATVPDAGEPAPPRLRPLVFVVAGAVLFAAAGVGALLATRSAPEPARRAEHARTPEPAPVEPSAKPAIDSAQPAAVDTKTGDTETVDTVEITLSDVPAGLEVYSASGVLLSANGESFTIERGSVPVVLELRAPDHKTSSRLIVPDKDSAIAAKLEPAQKRLPSIQRTGSSGRKHKGLPDGLPKPPQNTRGSLEDPFAK